MPAFYALFTSLRHSKRDKAGTDRARMLGKRRRAALADLARNWVGGCEPARLSRDKRGVTTIEFAFVAAPLMALIMASVQTSLTFFAQQNLETTAEKSVRQLLTGQAQNANMTQAQFQSLVCANLPAFMKCANVKVDIQVAANFSSANISTPTITYDSNGNVTNTWVYQPGTPGQITVARIMYVWSVNKGPLGFDLSTMSSKQRLLMSTSVFQTEPYSP